MRSAAVHLCFLDSGHSFVDWCRVMRSALSKQGYDKSAPLDDRPWSGEATATRAVASLAQKKSPPALNKGARLSTRSGWQSALPVAVQFRRNRTDFS